MTPDTNHPLTFEDIAAVVHAANTALCIAADDLPIAPPWDQAGESMRDSLVDAVAATLRGETAEDQHRTWGARLLSDGWTYGEVKDFEAKTHPCLVHYEDLPEFQRRKDDLRIAIVEALKPLCSGIRSRAEVDLLAHEG